jgi:hypothetical protein
MEKKPVLTAERQTLEADRAIAAVDRWIEALQILAGEDDNPTEAQRAEMARQRKTMFDLFAHAQAERLRAYVWARWPQQHTDGDTAADFIDPYPSGTDVPKGVR